MKVIRFERFGGPEVLHEAEVEPPAPQNTEMLVRNEAAGVNPVDYKIRSGAYPAVKQDRLPYTPGRDVSGVVVACGPDVTRFKPGDAIFAMPGIERGGYADHVLVREEEAAARPTAVDAVAAGATPLAALTAWQGLFRHGGLKAGQRVLIHGGAGGVGHFAVQFAKAFGAEVATTVSARHVEFAQKLGADVVVDYQTQHFEDEVGDVDLVFDLVDGDTQERSWKVLKVGGALISTLAQPSLEKAAGLVARALRYTVEESGPDLVEIAGLIDAGKVRPVVAKTFGLAEAAQAQQFLQTEHPAGKVVLVV
ncbi:NADPH:quinone reductase-like Zn-dependent oxidoreductase [Rhodoblastus acidophilus]|uniref:NADP-dependent oxidoreductase n=1 Tax=Rhodoblastus acidophilus TaxID=1074 RepID=UPI002224A0EA|nr:NADP-dependent oxidoreductase [Rhodoblastus acidophilus]MCW2284126.1 NADPH:quinone reductase-like Zn-dependent oxidoreductase [Rhodoblastus acidophilus]MCW2332822.1 NADPH:quinone reductase-like Zn-dependent oxidoreductase [Rhodoblastus acidophilus]